MDHRLRVLGFLLALSGACATPRGAPRPTWSIEADHFVGTIHTGALGEPVPADLGTPAWVGIRVAYADAAPNWPLEPVSARARQVFLEAGEDPVRSRSELALGVLRGPPAPGTAPARVDPLWTGTTTAWRIALDLEAEDPPSARWSSIEIEVSRPADPDAAPEVALVLEGPSGAREHLVLEAPSPELSLFFPAPSARSPGGGFGVEIVRSEPGSAEARERARSLLERASERARAGTGRLTEEEGFQFESSSALRALEDRALRRPALAFLSQVTGAAITGDLAVVAVPQSLEECLAAASASLRESDLDAGDAPALGWILEKATCAWLAARAADEERALEPELRAILLVHVGELARFPDLLADAVGESDSLGGFALRVAEENQVFLEDADPAARLRAFEWLGARGAAPEGYDPLGPLADRRAALDRARGEEGSR